MFSPEEVRKVEQSTIGQYLNPLWHRIKENKISSTQISKIVKRKKIITQDFVNSLHKKKDLSRIQAVAHGLKYESYAMAKYIEQTQNITRQVGLYTLKSHPYIVASPDGLFYNPIGEYYGVIEIKSPFSVRYNTIEEALKKLRYIDKKGKLKKKSDYFFQIQCQLACTETDICHFVIYTFKDIHIEKIPFDKNFWENKILPVLINFHQTWYQKKKPNTTTTPLTINQSQDRN